MSTIPNSADTTTSGNAPESKAPQVGGFAMIPQWMVMDPSITPAAIRIYLVLACHVHRDGTWRLTHKTIGEESGYGRTSVVEALNLLRGLGVVDWDTPDLKDPEQALGCIYRIRVDRSGADTPYSPDRTPPVRQNGHPVSGGADTNKDSPKTPHGGGDSVAAQQALDGLDAENVYAFKPTGRRKPSRPLPADWKPSPDHAALAARLGVDLATSVFTFRNYAAGRDWRMVDWDATFRNWVARDAQRSARPSAAAAPVRRDSNGRIREW